MPKKLIISINELEREEIYAYTNEEYNLYISDQYRTVKDLSKISIKTNINNEIHHILLTPQVDHFYKSILNFNFNDITFKVLKTIGIAPITTITSLTSNEKLELICEITSIQDPNPNYSLIEHILQISETENFISPIEKKFTQLFKTTSSSLVENKIYYVRVKSKNQVGISYSNVIKFKIVGIRDYVHNFSGWLYSTKPYYIYAGSVQRFFWNGQFVATLSNPINGNYRYVIGARRVKFLQYYEIGRYQLGLIGSTVEILP